MTDSLPLLIGAVLANNFVLTQLFGIAPSMRSDDRFDGIVMLAGALAFVLTTSALAEQLIDRFVLVPFELGYLRLLTFFVVAAALVQFTDIVVRRIDPPLHDALGGYLQLVTMNSAIFGFALLAETPRTLLATFFLALGTAVLFTLVIATFDALYARLNSSTMPAPFRGVPIALISAGLICLAFMGFRGIGG